MLILFLGFLSHKSYSITLVRADGSTISHTIAFKDSGRYILSIDQSKISIPKDTIALGRKLRYATFPLKFSNSSNDTLRYINMSCEWWIIYHFNNKSIGVLWEDCEKNVPQIIAIAPHRFTIINFPIIISKDGITHHQKFRVGMNLLKDKGTGNLFDLLKESKRLTSKGNMIWSNEVEIP